MIDFYIEFVKNNIILSSFIQFAILGLLGEYAGIYVSKKRISKAFTLPQALLKSLGWGFLGILIKYAFTGFVAFTNGLIAHHLLPSSFACVWIFSFFTSFFMNTLFGPQLMFLHRFIDNLIVKRKGFKGIEGALKTLIWFWIPAHTITFTLPVEFRIGLAALWSVVLGVILGFFKQKSGE